MSGLYSEIALRKNEQQRHGSERPGAVKMQIQGCMWCPPLARRAWRMVESRSGTSCRRSTEVNNAEEEAQKQPSAFLCGDHGAARSFLFAFVLPFVAFVLPRPIYFCGMQCMYCTVMRLPILRTVPLRGKKRAGVKELLHGQPGTGIIFDVM